MNEQNEKSVSIADKLESTQTNGPGAMLKQQRLAQNLELEAVAEQLNLTKDMVKRIEEDDFKGLAATAFIRGYLRSYAKLMKMNDDAVIEQFNSLHIQDQKPDMPTTRIYQTPKNAFHKSGTYILSILAIICILAIAYWLHTDFSDNQNLATSPSSEQAQSNATNVVKPLLPPTETSSSANKKP